MKKNRVSKKQKTEKTILLIDDDQAILEYLEAILKDQGYQVKKYDNGQSSQKAILEYPPDLILLDFFLPDGNGDQVIKNLKSKKTTRNIPVIVISAYQEAKGLALQAGANEFLSKPFETDILLNLIQKYTS